MKNKKKNNYGFTLIELLIAITILGIIAAFLSGNFISSQKKARDAQRKADLNQLQNALEMYYNDKGVYPNSSTGPGGKIVGCLGGTDCGTDPIACEWSDQSQFRDTKTSGCGSIYMQKLPKDPVNKQTYFYWAKDDGSFYKLWACLENTKDQKILNPTPAGTKCNGSCGDGCNYGVASPNAAP